MSKNLGPRILISGAIMMIFFTGKKKSKKGSSTSGNFRDYANADSSTINMQAAQSAINQYPRQVWVMVDRNYPETIGMLKTLLKAAALKRPDMGFALVGCHLFVPYEGSEACQERAWTWELRSSDGTVLEEGPVKSGFGAKLVSILEAY